jgi:GH15 family glucan-1,4-alpha-glucosidase
MARPLSQFEPPPGRVDGYLPLRGYALIGDGRTCALSSSDGSIDWWATPTMASPPVFARILDAGRGGYFSVCPVGRFDVRRGYTPDGAFPETLFRTSSGVVRVVDALTDVGGDEGHSGLVRHVFGVEGAVAMSWRVVVGDRLNSDDARALARDEEGVNWIGLGDERLAVLTHNAGDAELADDRSFVATFALSAGDEAMIAVLSTVSGVPSSEVVLRRVAEHARSWSTWTGRVRYDGPFAEQVRRSAAVLKQLTYVPTGALQAAATTSLPECLGSYLNYDYRFAWVRDTSFALDAMSTIGMDPEVRAVMRCLLKEVRTTEPQIKVLYSIEGEVVDTNDDEVVGWEGYAGSKPVRVGNKAASQRQLGVSGDLIDAVWRYVEHGEKLTGDDAAMIARIADEACGDWTKKDSGIWELEEHRHYTISKIGCWTALDRASRLARDGHIPDESVDRWEQTAAEIRSYVEEKCWSDEKRSYTMFAGGDALDCGVLLAGRTGYCAADDARLSSTVEAIRRELSAGGPLLYRYTGVKGDEGAFVACSFWLVEAMAYLGRVDDAREIMDGMVALANDVGLYSEQIDPRTFAFLGNLPQALSHLALIGAASSIAKASRVRAAEAS